MVYLLFAMIVMLLGLVVFLLLSFQTERQMLLDRIMAGDYRQYQLFKDGNKPEKELDSHGSPSDEEEARLELERQGDIANA